jgi:predicted transcriptional regulator
MHFKLRLSENQVLASIIITRSKARVNPQTLQEELGVLKGSISRIITALLDIGLVERAGGEILLAGTPPSEAFKRLYYSHRATPLQDILSGRRVELLSWLDSQPKSLEALAEETGISSDTIYYYLQGLRPFGIVNRSKHGKAYLYSFNYIIWKDLKDFVTTLLDFQVLRLVPRDALPLKSYGDSVLFKSLRTQDATPTSFSAYSEHGIKLGLRDNYYTLPRRDQSIEEVFIHSLDSAEDLRQRLFCILFYLKNKEALKKVQHPIIESFRAVLSGVQVKSYPSLEEIEEQAELYGIQDIKP